MKPRPVAAVAGFLLLAPLAGALLAPAVQGYVVPLLHRIWPDFAPFADPPFSRVLNRCVLVAALLFLVPALRVSGLLPELRTALRTSPGRLKSLALSVLLGLLSMGLAYAVGWWLGGYRLSDDDAGIGRLLMFLAGSVYIGLFEEAFFRGFVFGALRQRLGGMAGAIVASVFFSAVHFIQPSEGVPSGGGWRAGLALLPHLFGGFEPARDAAFAVTLFLMGLTLCRMYERDGHLWRAVGLHAGWVWAMQAGALVLDRNWAVMRDILGPSDYVAQGPLALPVVLAFFLSTLRRRNVAATG